MYREKFKTEMVKRLLSGRQSQAALSVETGVPESTLSRWKDEATTLDGVSKRKHGGARKGAGRPRNARGQRSSEEKLQIVLEAARLGDAELGAFLRDKGVFEAELLEWRQQALTALSGQPTRPVTPAEVQRIRSLERELRRKEKALAEAAALIVLQKKVQAMWGDADDDMDPTSEE